MNAFSCNVILLYATTEAIISIVPLVRKKGDVHIDDEENNMDDIEVKFPSKHRVVLSELFLIGFNRSAKKKLINSNRLIN